MYWVGVIGNEVVGSWWVPDVVKMTVQTYIDFFKVHGESLFKKKSNTFRKKAAFMHNNSPSHSVKKTNKHLNKMGFNGIQLIKSLASSSKLNQTENLWIILKRNIKLEDGNLPAKINFGMPFCLFHIRKYNRSENQWINDF